MLHLFLKRVFGHGLLVVGSGFFFFLSFIPASSLGLPSHIRCLRHSLDNDSLLDRVSTRHDTSDAPSEPLVCGRGLLVSLLFFPFGGQMQRPPLIWTCDSLSKAFLFRSKIMKHECPSLPTVMKKPLLWTHEPRGHFNQTGIQAAAGKQLSILDWPKSQ